MYCISFCVSFGITKVLYCVYCLLCFFVSVSCVFVGGTLDVVDLNSFFNKITSINVCTIVTGII